MATIYRSRSLSDTFPLKYHNISTEQDFIRLELNTIPKSMDYLNLIIPCFKWTIIYKKNHNNA